MMMMMTVCGVILSDLLKLLLFKGSDSARARADVTFKQSRWWQPFISKPERLHTDCKGRKGTGAVHT